MSDGATMTQTLYEQMGGESKLRAVINSLVDRMVSDVMIGFFFSGVNRPRLKELEFQQAAAFLGAPVAYRGRPLDVAHGHHNIMGGQFARRVQILKEIMMEENVPEAVAQAWLAHTRALQPLITANRGSDCDPATATPNGTGRA